MLGRQYMTKAYSKVECTAEKENAIGFKPSREPSVLTCPEHVHSPLHLATCQKMFDPVVMQITKHPFDSYKL